MKKMLSIFSLLAISYQPFAQTATLSVDTVNLGVVFENQADSAVVYLKNISTSWSVFSIERTAVFPFVGDTVVQVHFQNQLVLSGDSLAIWIKAQPIHNVQHKGSVLVDLGYEFGQIIIPYKFQARYSNTYYNTSENLWEADLRTALKNRISTGTVALSYNVARDNMYGSLDNVNGEVECIYTGRKATFNTRPGATANNFNCEHTWPQSLFSSNLPMVSDIFHLFPTDETANTVRGNLPFGVVPNPQWQVGGSKKNATTFEPRDAHKGACARGMMYFVLRYQDYSNFFAPQQAILRQWHLQFLPDSAEQVRNNGIFALQNNRNPFIDYPQFAKRITSLVGTTQQLADYGIFAFDTVALGYQQMSAAVAEITMYAANYSNTPVLFNGFTLSHPAMQFVVGSGVDVTVAPGHVVPIKIQYNIGQIFDGQKLEFDALATGFAPYTIYFKSVAAVFSVDENLEVNPIIHIKNNEVHWPASAGKWQMTDAFGRTLHTGDARLGMFTINSLPNGMYVFTLQNAQGVFSEKIILVNP